MPGVNISGLNIDELRSRLRAMTDSELLQFGKASRWLSGPKNNHGRPPREVSLFNYRKLVRSGEGGIPNSRDESQNKKKGRPPGFKTGPAPDGVTAFPAYSSEPTHRLWAPWSFLSLLWSRVGASPEHKRGRQARLPASPLFPLEGIRLAPQRAANR
jgi:hypothetical protein